MLLDYFSDYATAFGVLNGVILGILLLLATQYKYFFQKSNKNVVSSDSSGSASKETSDVQSSGKTSSEEVGTPEHDFSQKHLKEVAECALKLRNYKPLGEIGSGEPAALLLKQQYKKGCLPSVKLDVRSGCTESVNDGDSMIVNLPNEEEDDIDITELTPDDITVDDDVEDEDEDTKISPQAIADLEAELLNTSNSTEGSDEEEETIDETVEDGDRKFGPGGINSVASAKLRSERKKMSEEELAQERRIQQNQLSEILALMERNPEMFGNVSKDSLSDQAGLYCM